MNGIRFDGKHSYTDFGLILSSKLIGFPKPKTETVSVPGCDGNLDLTGALTDEVKFENRPLSFSFTMIDDDKGFLERVSIIANYLHGKRMKVILDNDRQFYYDGRCTINQFKTSAVLGTVTIDVDAFPYKIDVNSSAEPWVWDTFSFVDGIIFLGYVEVAGEVTVTFLNRTQTVTPIFETSTALVLVYEGKRFQLYQGKNRIPEVQFKQEKTEITFIGNGSVIIDYRGGSL